MNLKFNRWSALAGVALAAALAWNCGGDSASPDEHETPQPADVASVQLTPDYQAQQFRFLYFGGQPNVAALEAARDAGIRYVVSFREESETDFNEAAEAERLGLEYRNFPIPSGGAGYPEESIAAMETFLEEHHGEPMLLHCSSGNRAASWFGVHFVEAHDMSAEEAVAMAAAAGLDKEGARKRLEAYLAER